MHLNAEKSQRPRNTRINRRDVKRVDFVENMKLRWTIDSLVLLIQYLG